MSIAEKMAEKVPVDLSPDYEQFVVVAETEWKFDYGNYETDQAKIPLLNCSNPKCRKPNNGPVCSSCCQQLRFSLNPRITKHSLKLGTIEWNIAFNDQRKELEFTCQTVAECAVNEVHMELVHYSRSDPSESYEREYDDVMRHIFSPLTNSLKWNLYSRDNLFTLRILKDRPLFPDFTSENIKIGQLESNGKLRVCDQVFHVNKQALSVHSEYFNRMYNGGYKEANQEVVELKHAQADAAVFHDFLLVMSVTEALPNPKNVAILSDLANIYQAANVRDKCQLHLSMCRELPIGERYMLAGENGNQQLKTSIKRKIANLEEAEQIIDAVSKKAFAP